MGKKAEPLSILIMDDSRDDVSALSSRLTAAGYTLTVQQAETEAEFKAGLLTKPDLILADANLPRLSVQRALDVLADLEFDIPFIVLSASESEECGLETLVDRTTDLILKSRLDLAGVTVRRALRNAKLKREFRRLKEKQEKLPEVSARDSAT